MSHKPSNRAPANSRPVVSQLIPFNEHRFDDCMAYLAAKHQRALSTYEMIKLHLMIDVYHTLERGKQVIGGGFWPFTNGPVARSARARVTHWRNRYEKTGQMPDGFLLVDDGENLRAKPTRIPEEDDFSAAELAAMNRAWEDVIATLDRGGFGGSQKFFHDDSFIGKAWHKARNRGMFLDWNEIIEEYDNATGENHSQIKALLRY